MGAAWNGIDLNYALFAYHFGKVETKATASSETMPRMSLADNKKIEKQTKQIRNWKQTNKFENIRVKHNIDWA